MLGLKASWVGQSLVPVRCSASRENKPRTRKTKEERRKMVESFIKNHQNRNNGKFPSLNLTHKEVGGSFYIIREIVREIIQENKVLGPGNPSSKVLNLEYCLEEGSDIFGDAHSELSIAEIVHEMNCITDAVVKDAEVLGERSTNMIKSFPQVMFKSEEGTSSEVIHVETDLEQDASNGTLLHENLVSTGVKGLNVNNLIVKRDGDLGDSEKLAAFVQMNNEEDAVVPFVIQQDASHSTVLDYSFVESEITNEARDYNTPMVMHFLEESADASSTFSEKLSGKKLLFTETTSDQASSGPKIDNGGVFPLDEILDQDVSSEKSGLLPSYKISQVSDSSDEVHLSSDSLAEGDLINNIESQIAVFSSISSTSKASSSMNAAIVASILADEAPSQSIMDILPPCKSEDHVLEDKNISNLLLQAPTSPASGVTKNEVHLKDTKLSLTDTCIEPENASSKLLEPNVLEAVHKEFEAQKQTSLGTCNDRTFVSSKAAKDSEKKLETKSFWAAMKDFISSFMKFWSE